MLQDTETQFQQQKLSDYHIKVLVKQELLTLLEHLQFSVLFMLVNKGNNKITELLTIFQRECQNS